MSRSFRTQKRSVIAERRIARNKSGKIVLPRIIERKPYPGDSHPVQASFIRKMLERLPLEYLYGLKYIELLPRRNAVGRPYAQYDNNEKAIYLFSLPMAWDLTREYSNHAHTLARTWGAELIEADKLITVHWPQFWVRELWFSFDVFMHEVGHHVRNQFRMRDKKLDYDSEEMIADLFAARHYQREVRNLLKRIKERTPGEDS